MALPPTNPPGLVRDAEDLNKVVNGDGTTNRAGDSLPSIKAIIGVVEIRRDSAILAIQQAESDVQGALDDAVDRIITEGEQAAASTGWFVVGEFADGFEFTARNQVGRDSTGELWSYNGSLPFTVSAGTTPSPPDYTNRGDAALRSAIAAGTADIGGVLASELARKYGEFVTVKDFGAVGDGVTNDTNAFISAKDSSSTVILTPGRYFIDLVDLNDFNSIIGTDKNECVILVDGAQFEYVFRAIGKKGLTIKNIRIEYTDSPVATVNAIYFSSCEDITIKDVVGEIGRVIYLRGCSRVLIDNIERPELPERAPEISEPGGAIASIAGNPVNPICKGYIITNLRGFGLAEGVDFGTGVQDVLMDNLHFEGLPITTPWDGTDLDSGRFNEGIDIGGVRNITVNNFCIKGFGSGFLIKAEVDPVHNVVIGNGICEDYSISAVRILSRAVVGGLNEVENVIVSDVVARSDRQNSRVILGNNTGGETGSHNMQFINIDGVSDSFAIQLSGFTNVKFMGGRYESKGSTSLRVANFSAPGVTSSNFQIIGATLKSAGGTNGTTEAGISNGAVEKFKMSGCRVEFENQHTIMWMHNCLDFDLHDNFFGKVSFRGINVTYTNTDQLPESGQPLLAIIDKNRFEEWGERAIWITFGSTPQPATPYCGLRITDNNLVSETIKPNPSAVQDGLNFESIPAGYVDYSMVKGNIVRCERDFRSPDRLGVNAIFDQNLYIPT